MKRLTLIHSLVCLISLFMLSQSNVFCQEEFMIYGTLRIQNESPDSIVVTVESDKRQYGRKVVIDKTGEFKIWLKYAKDYTVKFAKPGYQTVSFYVSTKMPDQTNSCCFLPFDMSFHMFKPDGNHDSLFKKPIVKIRYEPKLKSYFYSLDIDYYIQKMIIKADIDRQQKIKNFARQSQINDSLEIERQYLSLINSGNLYFSKRQYIMARKIFEKAQQINPKRKYPAYKLEDINTELEIFKKKTDSLDRNVDSVIMAVTKKETEIKPVSTAYKRKTPEEIEALFKKDLHAQISKETTNKEELEQRLTFVNNVVYTTKKDSIKPVSPVNIVQQNETKVVETKRTDSLYQRDTVVNIIDQHNEIKIDSVKKDTVSKKKQVQEVSITTIPKPIPTQVAATIQRDTTLQIFNKAAYQDSLLKKYPNEKTIEIINEKYKKITKVFINRNEFVIIYLKVEHSWGAVFYFIDNTPYPLENISESYFESMTKLSSDNAKTKNISTDSLKIKN